MNIVAVILAFLLASTPNQPSACIAEPELVIANEGNCYPISVDEYIAGVVVHEMPHTFSMEALQAQAVAARTYLYYCLENNSHPHTENFDGTSIDVCTDITHCCGFTTEEALAARFGEAYAREAMTISRAAANATSDEVMEYDGEYILAMWHSSSSEKTADCAELFGAKPYLTSVDSYESAEISVVSFTPIQVKSRLATIGKHYNLQKTILIEPTASGRCAYLTIGNVRLSGREVRELFGLKSTDFDAWFGEDGLKFRVRGYGHGIGLSQYGANAMARDGFSHKEILEHYYNGAVLTKTRKNNIDSSD